MSFATMQTHEADVIERERKTAALGYDYEESKFLQSELDTFDYKTVYKYELGILTGGELDCLIIHGDLPWHIYDRMSRVC